MAVSENNLYVAASPDFSQTMKSPEAKEAYYRKSITSNKVQWSIFHSTDLGNTWAEITPKNVPFSMQASRDITLLVAGKTLLALSDMNGIRSNDGGKTWTDLGKSYTYHYTPAVAVNENIIYAGEIRRTTNGGKSWEPFMKGTIGTEMRNLVAFKNGLYVHNDSKIVKSMDSGESWTPVSFRKDRGSPRDPDFPNQRLVIADGIPYGVSLEEKKKKLSIFEIIFGLSSHSRKSKMRIFHLSTDGNTLSPVRGLPALEFDDDLYTKDLIANEMTLGELAVSNDTFENSSSVNPVHRNGRAQDSLIPKNSPVTIAKGFSWLFQGKPFTSVSGTANSFNRLMVGTIGRTLHQTYRFRLTISERSSLRVQRFMLQLTKGF